MKKFCEKDIANLDYTPQEKKIEYIILKIQQDFSSIANYEKKYLQTNPIEKPTSLPNNGKEVSWSIEDYDNFVKYETDNCPNLLNKKKNEAQENLDKSINKLKSDKYKNQLNKVSVDENEFNRSIENLKVDYEKKIESLNDFCDKEKVKNTKYRDEWVTYLKAKPIYDNLQKEYFSATLETEEQNRKNRVEFDETEKVKKNKIKEDARIAKTKEDLNSVEYKNWKTKYLSIINSAKANAAIMNNLENKYTFRNNFGDKVLDRASFSKQDQINYNKNYDAIVKKLDDITQLQKIGRNEYFQSIYTDSVIDKLEVLDLPNLAQFYSVRLKF